MDIKEVCNKYHVNYTFISGKFNIPYRSVQNWGTGTRTSPDYVIDMIDRILSLEEQNRDMESKLRAVAAAVKNIL